jgi:hypothetical protein
MPILLLTLLLATQGLPGQRPSGTITGVVRDSTGKPALGVRVGAIAVPDSTQDVAGASSMVSLAETDAVGQYRLENVPPGRYYIAAGRVDFPTYYPGTQALARGNVVSITSSAVVSGIDFTLQDSSRATVLTLGLPLTFSLPVQVTVEGAGKLPVFSPAGFVLIALRDTTTGVRTDIPVNATTIVVPSQTAEYRVSVENLPAGYRVKSMTAGTTDVAASGLKLSAMIFKAVTPSPTNTQMVAAAGLSIALTSPGAAAAQPSTSGVRVSGRVKGTERRSIYISGQPGTFYSDGTFEFRAVPAGRHTLATIESPDSTRLLGASVVVANLDVEGIELEEIRLLPMDLRSTSRPRDAGGHSAGSAVRLASLRVAVVDEQSGEPAGPGTVYIFGPFGTSLDLPLDGRLEFPRLLPGDYSFEIQVFRHATIARTIAVDDQDVTLELSVASID